MSQESDPTTKSSGSFLRRWSDRKHTKRVDDQPEVDEVIGDDEMPLPLNTVVSEKTPGRMQTMVEADRQKLTEETDNTEQPVLTDEDMPSVESLNEKSDYSGFMSSGVSRKLRNKALRKLFSAAVFNVRDGLDDYDDDFTNFEPLGDIVTSDMKHQAEVEERRRREAEQAKQQAEAEAESTESPEDQPETAEEVVSDSSDEETDNERLVEADQIPDTEQSKT